MYPFSALNVFKSLSKSIARQQSLQLAETRERLSIAAGFSSYHELHSVATRRPEEARLLRAVFGVDKFADVMLIPDVASTLRREVIRKALQDDLIAATLVGSIELDHLIIYTRYDPERGVLAISSRADLVSIETSGYGKQFQSYNATIGFDVTFRDQRWQVASSTVVLELALDEDGLIEDFIDDFPSSEFWD